MRPAVVLLDSGDLDFVGAPITSRFRSSNFDVAIHQWREAGLNTASTIRVDKLTVLSKDEIVRRIGELTKADRSTLQEVLRHAFSLDLSASYDLRIKAALTQAGGDPVLAGETL